MYTVNDRTYTFGVIPPIEALRVEVSIARVIGEPLFKAFMDTKKTGAGEDVSEQAGVTAIGLMLSKMDADELIATMEIVFKYVSCDGKRVNIEAHFVGKNKELWQVFTEALKHNFSDFFPESLSGSIRKGMQASS